MSRSVTARIKPGSRASVDSGMLSVAGGRPQNEDRVDLFQDSNELIGLLADGMGGGEIGATMSDQAVRVARESLRDTPNDEPRLRLERAFRLANQALLNLTQVSSRYRESGSTLVGMVLQIHPSGVVAHIGKLGDSRAYILPAQGSLRQIGRDHTYGEELLSAGQDARVAGAEELTYALGSELQIEQVPDFYHAVPLHAGDTLLLCSDGLSAFIREDELVTLIARGSAQQAAEQLVRRSLRNGSDDNISAIVVRYDGRSPKALPWIVPTGLIGLVLLLLAAGAFALWGDVVFGQGGGTPPDSGVPAATITSYPLPLASTETSPPTTSTRTLPAEPTSTRAATATPSPTHTATPTSTPRPRPTTRPTRIPPPVTAAPANSPPPVDPAATAPLPVPTEVSPVVATETPPLAPTEVSQPTEVPPPAPTEVPPPAPTEVTGDTGQPIDIGTVAPIVTSGP